VSRRSFRRRIALSADIERSEATIRIIDTHLASHDDAEERLKQAREVRTLVEASTMPTVVAGDLNDVAWSHTSRLFCRLSRTIDPRIGRGFLNSFDATCWWMRCREFGTLDVMFNNAGIGGAFGPITEVDVDAWDRTFEVLVRGVFLGTKHAARVMIPQGGGAIVNTASVAGLAGGSGHTGYSAAKTAVVSMTRSTAEELAPHRIRVNAVCPGVIFTPLAVGKDEEALGEVVRTLQPWPDRGMPEDIAAAVAFLASDDARFVVGEALLVDGGLLAAGTRIHKHMDPYGATKRYTGFGAGSTGEQTTSRRVAPKE